MSTFSVDDQTRMSSTRQDGTTKPRIRVPLQGRYTDPLEPLFDDQFESQLPPEIRAELETPRAEINRPPFQIPETEQEIKAAIAWLRSQGYLQSDSSPTPSRESPPISSPQPPVIPPAAQPPRSSPSSIWWMLAMLLGLAFLLSRQANPTQPQDRQAQVGATLPAPSSSSTQVPQPTAQRWVEVRRALPAVEVRKALPVVPRALPVTAGNSTVSNTVWQSIQMPDGSFIGVRYMGELSNSAALPAHGDFIGQEYSVGSTSWIWMTRPGMTTPSWVDP
jgi:hypothetical protein